MSDVDYNALFLNGQLQYAEPTHKAILDQMFRAHDGQGTLEEQILKDKYRAYMEAFHPLNVQVLPPSPVEEQLVLAAAATEDEVATAEDAPEVAEDEETTEEVDESPKRRGRKVSSPS